MVCLSLRVLLYVSNAEQKVAHEAMLVGAEVFAPPVIGQDLVVGVKEGTLLISVK